MMKKLSILLIIVLFSNCKALKLFMNEELIVKENVCNFDLKDNRILLNTKIDGKENKLIFDLGSTRDYIFDTILVNDLYKKQKINNILIDKVGGGNVKNWSVPVNIETDLYKFNNSVTSIFNRGYENDCFKSDEKGLIGSRFLVKDKKKILKINFENNQLELINRNDLKNILENYSQIKSKFKKGLFNIYLNFDGKENPFLFDTGNPSDIFIHSNDIEIKNYKSKKEYLGSPLISFDNVVEQNTTNFEDVEFIFNNKVVSCNATKFVVKKSEENNVGVGFLKRYNWIIDYETKKVFVQKNNQIEQNTQMPDYKYLFIIKENKIILASKLKSEMKYNIGDEVISINGIKVSEDNICEMHRLLVKNNNNLEDLKIEVKQK